MRIPHGFAVDWWAFGVFLFELLTSCDPFSLPLQDASPGEGDATLSERICGVKYEWPKLRRMSQQIASGKDLVPAKKLVEGLLQREPAKRLGCKQVRELIDTHLGLSLPAHFTHHPHHSTPARSLWHLQVGKDPDPDQTFWDVKCTSVPQDVKANQFFAVKDGSYEKGV